MLPGADGRSNDPGENGTRNIGNPDDWIPVLLPGQPTEEDAITIPGNLDIRIPDGIERKDGLRTRGAAEKEDAKEKGAERGDGPEERPDHKSEEEQKEASSEDTPKGREGPEEPERRHAPGGTWLSQLRKVKIYNYADDMQLIFTIDDTLESKEFFQKTMLYIQDWMNIHQLKLKSDKIKIVVTKNKI
ncbi:hypothetical protein NDU88_000777 [Pleurodeles waltl]|uniref:Reverse transcriptase domain-containing protein n=1 Tax=Pleurodeles waltl TaxID=8319 RepID=A0AAV7VA00_PLEWA|nr:hypothetical protein NDU88_000777 [Pleurodeles waltl]